MRKTELLVPAGSLDVLKTAVIFGADAVYLGGEAFGLRAKAKNFTNEETTAIIILSKETVNIPLTVFFYPLQFRIVPQAKIEKYSSYIQQEEEYLYEGSFLEWHQYV